jgi:hypothetical protein
MSLNSLDIWRNEYEISPLDSECPSRYLPRSSVILRKTLRKFYYWFLFLVVIFPCYSIHSELRIFLTTRVLPSRDTSSQPKSFRVTVQFVGSRRPNLSFLAFVRNLALPRITPSTIQVHWGCGIYCPSQPDTGILSSIAFSEPFRSLTALGVPPRLTQVHLSLVSIVILSMIQSLLVSEITRKWYGTFHRTYCPISLVRPHRVLPY